MADAASCSVGAVEPTNPNCAKGKPRQVSNSSVEEKRYARLAWRTAHHSENIANLLDKSIHQAYGRDMEGHPRWLKC